MLGHSAYYSPRNSVIFAICPEMALNEGDSESQICYVRKTPSDSQSWEVHSKCTQSALIKNDRKTPSGSQKREVHSLYSYGPKYNKSFFLPRVVNLHGQFEIHEKVSKVSALLFKATVRADIPSLTRWVHFECTSTRAARTGRFRVSALLKTEGFCGFLVFRRIVYSRQKKIPDDAEI